jgi:putative transposase
VQEDNLVAYRNPGVALPVADPLTEVLRQGARDLLQKAIEAEAAAIIGQYQELKLSRAGNE